MAQIRRKTAGDRRDAFRYARKKGIALSWDRYEDMLPQDGFARLGLTCFDCLMGPCRLDPFARKEERTVCGFTPDDLVCRTIMGLLGAPPAAGCHVESILDAARQRAMAEKPGRGGAYRIGPGLLERDRPNVCTEAADPALLEKLSAAGLNAVTVGELANGYNCASSLCEGEFLLLTGLVDAYVTGPNGIGLPRGAAEPLHTAVVNGDDPDAVIAAAEDAFSKRGEIRPDNSAVEIEAVSMKTALEQAGRNAVVIGGDGNIKLTLDALALDAVKAFREQDRPVIVCGGMVPALAKYRLNGVIWCCDRAGALLQSGAGNKPLVLLPGIATGYGVAEATALGGAGYGVLTATELPLGCGKLGEQLGKLVRYAKADEYIAAAKGV